MMETIICHNCQKSFTLTSEDLDFYKRIGVLKPIDCPLCREQRRLCFRNERNLYLRPCESCKKQMVSIYSPDKPHHVYCQQCWWSDKWDPVDIGRPFDFNKTFFEQFDDLIKSSKLITLFGKNNQNSEYVNQETDDKNCYLNVGGHFNEDCFYNTYSLWGKNNVDNIWVIKSQLLYQCVTCENCYNGTYLIDCINCTDCHYCQDCTGCNDCFGSFGLRHKQYYFFNKQLEKTEYFQKINECLQNFQTREETRQKSLQHFLKFPHRATLIIQCENSTGDKMVNCKNVFEGYTCEEMEDCRYTYIAINAKDSQDLTSLGFSEITYNSGSSFELNNVIAVSSTTKLNFSQYCFVCFNSANLFGCVGLNHKEYCILNKQYTKEIFYELKTKIIEHMKKTGEYGQFFPTKISPFCYNETVAQEYFPLTKEEILKKGYRWKEKNVKQYATHDAPTCSTCAKNYRIIPQELAFYKRVNLPIPQKCPDCRHNDRMKLRNPRQLWKRNCAKCNAQISTSYAPERPEIVYCEKCYLKAVY